MLRAPRVEVAHLLWRERAGVLPHHFVTAVGEGVLDVELDLVHLPRREACDEVLDGRERRNLVARDVEHHAADGEVGPIADAAHGKVVVARTNQLRERGAPVELTGSVRRRELHTVRADVE